MGDLDTEIGLAGDDYDIEDEEEDYEYLALPDVDEEYLDDVKHDDTQVLNKIPFTKIHEDPVPFDSPKRRCFMPGQKIFVKITDVEQADTGLFNPNLYVIHLSHGDYHWVIRRRYKHFRTLHDNLMLFRARIAVSMPTKSVKERRKSFAVKKQHLPKFPKTPEPLVRTDRVDKRKVQLEEYLQNVLRHTQFRNHPDTLRFLEVSHLTFVKGLGGKWKEGILRKRAGGRRIRLKTCGCCPTLHCTATWTNRWLVLKDTFVAYISPKTGAIGDVLLMDRDFSVQNGILHTGISHGLVISNLCRHLIMKCETHRQADEWVDEINKAIRETGQDFTQTNRYHSFAPVRTNAFVNWFVDGANYMAAVADAIEGAKEEIFITDWWLSPELYLKRPITEEQKFRLDLLLGRKAAQGVQVYVLLFKEMEAALGINSLHTKQTLVKQHPNIRVLRHPDGITLWSHHEKIVVIDQRIAFLGGIDLCFGRWDTSSHRLTDLGTKTVADDLNTSDEDSNDEPLGAIEEESDEEFVNINLNNNSNSCENVNEDNDADIDVVDDRDDRNTITDSSDDVQVSERSHLKPASADDDGNTKIRVSCTVEDVDLNFNNNGNGEDARKKEQQLSGRESVSGCYPPPPKAFRSITSQLKWDSDADHDTEESDIDMGPGHDHRVNVMAKQKPCLKLDPGLHGSYANPDADIIMREERFGKAPKCRSGPHGYLGEDEVMDGCLQGQPRCNDSRQMKLDNQRDPVLLAHNNDNNLSHRSELSVSVSSSRNYLTVNDACHQRTQNDCRPMGASLSSNGPVNGDRSNDVPVIEITDTSRQERGRHAKPILRKIQKQMTFDEDDVDFVLNDGNVSTQNARSCNNTNSKPREGNRKTGEPKNWTSKSPASKQDSAASTTSGSSLDNQTKEGNPKSFNAYLQMVKTQDLPSRLPEWSHDPGHRESSSIIQTGPSGLFVGFTNTDVPPPQTNKTASPHIRHRIRPPKLSFGMKHFGRGTAALDEDTAASLAETGGRLPPAQKDKHVAYYHDSGPEPAVALQLGPKPPTPEPKKKTYDIKERFRKDKMVSIDVTDDLAAFSWKDRYKQYKALYKRADSIRDTRQILNPHELIEKEGRENEVCFWIGKDYANFIYKDFVELDKPFTDMVDRTEIPRMPWHDIGCMVAGRAARDVARHFIQRWNFTKLSKQKANNNYPLLLPKAYSKVSLPQWVVSESYCANCQILRSSCEWSAGIKTIECSIHEAYIDLILKAKYFIYIENQFFVTIMESDVVENQIARALYERILAAHKKKETFRVYVVMPLLPAFEGELGTSTGTSIQAVTHWNYASICRGGKSLLERLAKDLRDPFEYISFYGLRTYEKLCSKLTTELVYVHSKLMIVDDRNVILGSANINDRSLLGKRDSEIAIVIEDKHTVTTVFNGVKVEVGKFASDMRRNIFREHLGVKEDDPVVDVCDPVSSGFYKDTWLRQASINTTIFEQVFRCVPNDEVHTYHQLRTYQKGIPLAKKNPEKAEKKLKKVKGHLVLMPLMFLSKENLGNLAGTREGILPNIVWT